jgi:hypothetical protein
MSWRTGSAIFVEIWPVIEQRVAARQERIELTRDLLVLFVARDMDPWDVEDLHPDVRAAMKLARLPIREPERYADTRD